MTEDGSGGGRMDDRDSGADGDSAEGDNVGGDSASGASGDSAGGDQVDVALRAIIEGSAEEARFREPSARERGKLAKQARQKQQDEARKYAKLEKETRKEAEAARKKSRRQARRQTASRRAARGTAWTVGVAVLVAAGVFAYSRFGHSTPGSAGLNDAGTVTNGALPPTKTPVSPLTNSGPPSDPFTGTPADKWADGAAGIVLPAAKPIGQYPASKVEYAYQTTKKLLAAAALDKQTLTGGAPTAFANLLTQDQRNEFVSQLDKIGLDKYGFAVSSRGLIMQFAPGTAKLIGSAIKVRGTMSAAATKDSSGEPILQVTINYLVVYPIEPPGAPADWMRVVTQFYGTIEFGDWQDADTPFEAWWQANPTSVAGALCGTKDGFQHPAYPQGAQGSVTPSGPATNPYSFAKPSGNGGCGTTTGT